MARDSAINDAIEQRVNYLLLGINAARRVAPEEIRLGLARPLNVNEIAERNLLNIEKEAVKRKDVKARNLQHRLDDVSESLHQQLEAVIQQQMADIDGLASRVLGISPVLPQLLDTLSVRAATITRVEPMVAAMPWLQNELIRMVNGPKFRRTDGKGGAIKIDSLRMAIGRLGLENLKLIVPCLAMRRYMPMVTDPYPDLKKQLWKLALGTANACKEIATHHRADSTHAFILGMFSQLGSVAVTKLYFRHFDVIHREALIEAHDAKDRDRYGLLTQITPSADHLTSLISRLAPGLSQRLIGHMGFKRIFIQHAIEEVVAGTPVSARSPLANCLVQGRAYCHFRMLRGAKLITTDEAKRYLTAMSLPNEALLALKSVNLAVLPVSGDN